MEFGDGRWKAEVRGTRLEVRSWRLEVGVRSSRLAVGGIQFSIFRSRENKQLLMAIVVISTF